MWWGRGGNVVFPGEGHKSRMGACEEGRMVSRREAKRSPLHPRPLLCGLWVLTWK